MQKVAKCFLHFLNHSTLDKPSVRCQTISQDEAVLYKVNYTRYESSNHQLKVKDEKLTIVFWILFPFRWLIFCHMPMFCSSLPHYDTTLIFGRTLLRAVFHSESKKLLDRCQADKNNFTEEQSVLFLHLPKWVFFLNLIFSHRSHALRIPKNWRFLVGFFRCFKKIYLRQIQ